jgi:hypothetical protein
MITASRSPNQPVSSDDLSGRVRGEIKEKGD